MKRQWSGTDTTEIPSCPRLKREIAEQKQKSMTASNTTESKRKAKRASLSKQMAHQTNQNKATKHRGQIEKWANNDKNKP